MHLRKKHKKNRMGLYMALFIIFIMVASVFAIIISAPRDSSTVTYGNAEFIRLNNPVDAHRYIMKFEGRKIPVYYLPDDVYDISIDDSIVSLVKNADALIFTFDPSNMTADDKIVVDVMRFELVQYFELPSRQGVTRLSDDYSLPVLTCENATVEMPVIYFSLAGRSKITVEDNCVIVAGKEVELIRSGSRLLYAVLGVHPSFG